MRCSLHGELQLTASTSPGHFGWMLSESFLVIFFSLSFAICSLTWHLIQGDIALPGILHQELQQAALRRLPQ